MSEQKYYVYYKRNHQEYVMYDRTVTTQEAAEHRCFELDDGSRVVWYQLEPLKGAYI